MLLAVYCKFVNFRENFIFTKSVTRHLASLKIRDYGIVNLFSVNDRVISPFREGFIFTNYAKIRENKSLTKIYELQYRFPLKCLRVLNESEYII